MLHACGLHVNGMCHVQALDEEYLKVDAQFGGVDQRKIFTFAEKVRQAFPCPQGSIHFMSTATVPVPPSPGVQEEDPSHEPHGYVQEVEGVHVCLIPPPCVVPGLTGTKMSASDPVSLKRGVCTF